MRYTFKCPSNHLSVVERSIKEGPPETYPCDLCARLAKRSWKDDAPMIDTSACRDHSHIPEDKRVVSQFDKGSADQQERQFEKHIRDRRKLIKDAGGQRPDLKQTHSVPTHLYHGKIRETGDKQYWNDPKNLAKHTDCKVDV